MPEHLVRQRIKYLIEHGEPPPCAVRQTPRLWRMLAAMLAVQLITLLVAYLR